MSYKSVARPAGTVVPTKSDSDVMFYLQSYQDLESIDDLCINPIRRIGLIHKSSIDSRVSSSEVYTLVFNLAIVNKVYYVAVILGWYDSMYLNYYVSPPVYPPVSSK